MYHAKQVLRRGEILLILEVNDDTEAKAYEVNNATVVKKILSREERRSSCEKDEVVAPNYSPEKLR
jgi:hypothetical protein